MRQKIHVRHALCSIFLAQALAWGTPLNADLEKKVGELHAALVALKTKLQTLDTGLETLYAKLNPVKPPLFVAQTVKRLTNLKLAGVSHTQDSETFDDVNGQYETTMTYKPSGDTSIELEFKHNRASKSGTITMLCEGPNHYARWEKIADFAKIIAALMNNGGGVMSRSDNQVVFNWPAQEKQWYSRVLHKFVRSVILLTQAVGGLQQEVLDPSTGGTKIVSGPVQVKEAEALGTLKKILRNSNVLLERFLQSIFEYSLNAPRVHSFFLHTLDFIDKGPDGKSAWSSALNIIEHYFDDNDFANQTDINFFKAYHTPLAVGPNEQAIVDYDSLDISALDAHNKSPDETFVKSFLGISSYRSALIQKLFNNIVEKKLYESMSEDTFRELLNLMNQNANFFAKLGSWNGNNLEASKELGALLQWAQSNGYANEVQQIKNKIGFRSLLVNPNSLIRKNATLLLGGVPLNKDIFEKMLAKYLGRLVNASDGPSMIQRAYTESPEFVKAHCEAFFSQALATESSETLVTNIQSLIRFFQTIDVHFRERVITATILKKEKNFSWINQTEDLWVGGMRKPTNRLQLEQLKVINIGLLVSLQKLDFVASPFTDIDLENFYLKVPDYSIPTIAQVNKFIERADLCHAQGKRVVVHCTAGMGRTGTLLACWLVAKKKFAPQQAIDLIRELRPGSIETEQQEQFVQIFYESLGK